MLDGKLMRNLSITVKHIRACWRWRAHTGRDKQAHSSVPFFPLHTSTRAHTHLPLLQRLTFPSHTSAVLHSSAWIRALVWTITSSTGGEGPSIPPSICYSTPGSILSREQGDESNTRRKRISQHLHKILCDHKENPLI